MICQTMPQQAFVVNSGEVAGAHQIDNQPSGLGRGRLDRWAKPVGEGKRAEDHEGKNC